MEPSSSVKLALKEHAVLITEGLRRINEYKITKFDKIQFLETCGNIDPATGLPSKAVGLEIGKDFTQRILGTDYQLMRYKMQYKNTKLLAQVNFEQFCLYHMLITEKETELLLTLNTKVLNLLIEQD